MKKHVLAIVCVAVFIYGCHDKNNDPVAPAADSGTSEVPVKWSKLLIEFVKNQPFNSPTFASRGFGYAGLTMYESVAAGSSTYQSIAPSLNGLGTLPKPTTGKTVDWETSMNAAESYIIRNIWQHSNQTYLNKLDSLESAIEKTRSAIVKDTAIINYSKKYGKSIADKIYQWSMTDGGHLAYLTTFDTNFKVPTGAQYWTPPLNGQSSQPYPMHPYWGTHRTFVTANGSIPMPSKMNYTTDSNSDYFAMFKNVYTTNKNLTQAQKEIALWWGDDPSATAAPAGHSFSLVSQLAAQKNLNLVETALTFAKESISVADAFVCCWKVKFNYFSIRPAEYINHTFDASFVQFWPEPPFPAFPSGHSTQSAAAATAMISVFGDNVVFTDNTHKGRAKDLIRNTDYLPRTFTSIWSTAEECGMSRVYGGIHTSEDNLAGLSLGKQLATNVVNLAWKK